MTNRTIRLQIVLVLFTLALQACSAASTPASEAAPPAEANETATEAAVLPTDTTEAPTAAPAQPAACDNQYMPVVAGATWSYKLSGPVPDTYVHTVLAVNENGFTEQDLFASGVSRQGEWVCENGNLLAMNPPSGSSGSVSSEDVQVDFKTTEKSGYTLPATIATGDTWSQTLTLEGTQTISGTVYPARNQMTYDCKALGIESVTVEAGTFDAMRVECKIVMNISITVAGSETGTTLNLTGTNWYVENTGMVKNLTTGLGFDTVTELVAYNIP